MSKEYDLIVIGTGPAGKNIANGAADAGLKVATIEADGYGGTCPNHGCTPKKILSSTAAKIAETNRLVGRGVQEETFMNWEDLLAVKRNYVDPLSRINEEKLQGKGVATYHGYASFISENEVKVNEDILKAKKIVIATGATPVTLPIDGVENLVLSDGFFELDRMPEHLIFVGGGYISFEFAHIAARAGSKVTILEGGSQALSGFDPDLTELLVKYSRDIGIDIHLKTKVTGIKQQEEGYQVKGTKDEEEVNFEGDLVMHGAGRVPNVEKLALDKAHIDYDKQGIIINERHESVSNPHVYAAGDVAKTNGPPLTPVGHLHAKLVISQLLGQAHEPLNYHGIPSVAFTTPKIGMTGLSEQEAKESDQEVEVDWLDMTDWFTYEHVNQPVAATKLIIDKKTDQLLGAHVLADEADQLINYFAAAIQLKLTTKQLKTVTYAFPTPFSDIPNMF